ncbi:Nose resistant to fluoxetine protein 6 like protein [Argiope bruennichi]|uniref:Nose resistant to fluoxetine protein 6 like protein n=2 Tax=Argiope bruennichi TaxID=94029 RepID=A0A8T0G1L3_ARGBR|nr:Nose resistant to fluoxetine protein 6 like protein [Argiope bruennichi]
MEAAFGNMTLTCKPITRKLSTGAISVISFLSLFALLALIGSSITVVEYYTKADPVDEPAHSASVNGKPTINGDSGLVRKDSVEILVDDSRQETKLPAWLENCKSFFNCFCVFTNGEKILNVESSEGQLPSLHGIRFLSMTWVILCHSYAFCGMLTRNLAETIQFVDHWFFQIILNGFYSVDSFFLLSGFLVAYLFFQQCAKSNGKIPWVYFYVHRYLRLTPVYAIVMLFYTFVNPYIADGPLWPDVDHDQNCYDNWWYNLLYINNFQAIAGQCMSWSWYLANDMQFYIISPLFLITLWRWPKVGYSLIGIGLVATFVTTFTITFVYDSFTGLGNVVEAAVDLQGFLVRWSDFFDKIYTKPYTRVGPYLLGLVLAYYLYKWKQNNPQKLKSTTLAAGWAIASAIALACLFGLYHQNLSTVGAGFYNGLNRIGFALGLSWVIFVCVTGQGGVVNSLLSWKVWIPLSRLTYCAYLVHPIVQNGYYTSVRRMVEFSHTSVILFYLGFLIIAYTAALITTLLFESPVIRLEKYVRNKFAS